MLVRSFVFLIVFVVSFPLLTSCSINPYSEHILHRKLDCILLLLCEFKQNMFSVFINSSNPIHSDLIYDLLSVLSKRLTELDVSAIDTILDSMFFPNPCSTLFINFLTRLYWFCIFIWWYMLIWWLGRLWNEA